MAVAAVPTDVRTEPLVSEASGRQWRPWEEDGDCRPGAKAPRGTVEVRQQRRRHRRGGDEDRLSAPAIALSFGRTLTSFDGSRWVNRSIPWLRQPPFENGLAFLSPTRRKRDCGAAAMCADRM